MVIREMIKRGNRRGVSPVIATVLLVTMVVVLALIIFLWFRNFNKEAVCKFEDCVNVEIVCADVEFESSYSGGSLYVLNSGSVPMYSMKMRVYEGGNYETLDLQDISDSSWPEKGLNPGFAFSSSTLSGEIGGSSVDKVLMIPVLVGLNEDGEERLHTCREDFAQQLAI